MAGVEVARGKEGEAGARVMAAGAGAAAKAAAAVAVTAAAAARVRQGGWWTAWSSGRASWRLSGLQRRSSRARGLRVGIGNS